MNSTIKKIDDMSKTLLNNVKVTDDILDEIISESEELNKLLKKYFEKYDDDKVISEDDYLDLLDLNCGQVTKDIIFRYTLL